MILLGTDRRRALAAIASLTLVGAALRIARLGRLGLVQFDEGIYAFAGLWSMIPGGLARLDPMVIPYSPPAFPFLVGVSYSLLGVSDLSAIVVSILMGILTIPVVGWLGWRTFGPPAGIAAAAFAAFSGVHVAFSRMALTDASFLLAWLVAIGIGQRFLEQPRYSGAVALGVAVGIAQYFKYNGWLTGASTALAVLLGTIFDPRERRDGRIVRMAGLGAAAALTAALVYVPWFQFVEAHGGYVGLLAHQRGYMGGLSSWLPHWRYQLAQGMALSGGPTWGALAMLLAFIGVWVTSPLHGGISGTAKYGIATIVGSTLLAFMPMASWWMAFAWMFGPWSSRPVAARVLGGWWLLLAVLTPFYHPYARLWLPLHAASWIITAGVIASLAPLISRSVESPRPVSPPRRVPVVIGLVATLAIGHMVLDTPHARPLPGLLEPSDSLRMACQGLARVVPDEAPGIRLLARPPVRFYLSLFGRWPLQTEPDLQSLLSRVDPTSWVVVDEALLRQEGDPSAARRRLLETYVLVREWPTELNLPTLLDVDPTAARRASGARSASLLLLRHERPRVSP